MYYLKRQLLDSDRKYLSETVAKGSLEEIYDAVEDMAIDTKPIMSVSAGWRAVCNPDLKVSEKTYQGLLRYVRDELQTRKYMLIDEYKREVTMDELERVIDDHKSGYDIHSYEEQFPERRTIVNLKEEIGTDGSRWIEEIFYNV